MTQWEMAKNLWFCTLIKFYPQLDFTLSNIRRNTSDHQNSKLTKQS